MLYNRSKQQQYQIPFFLFLSLIAVAIWVLLRIVLWLQVGVSQLTLGQLVHTSALGAWFDLAALAYLVVPFLLASILLPNRWRAKQWLQKYRVDFSGESLS